MTEPKPFASLSSGLLARKGGAKPAMRPQSFSPLGGNFEDLGWNDMGHVADAAPEHVPSSIAALTPAPRLQDRLLSSDGIEQTVAEQQRAIATSFPSAEEEGEDQYSAKSTVVAPDLTPAAVVPLPLRTRRAAGVKDKAAFTLRLDRERHLKLRLACAITHRSAQQFVIEALERHLNAMPELETLARQLPAAAGKRS